VVIILLSALIVIDPDFMGQVLGSKARFSNYVDIAVLSASLGTVAGALGSSFDSDVDIRRLTHGQRERQRMNSAE
jgi:small basic protein